MIDRKLFHSYTRYIGMIQLDNIVRMVLVRFLSK
jgi:hypothetical protein